ncbi:lipid IV(A) 3-deoxy-D-manno-octulosonic acid transferase [Pelagibaculum spongiae]|uniref:3-deoxy-D-manno-octulosonic acid transferase n=1 Tax=Pelagibaculum spongiae TaxID=2080658 RepID=A0A2V1GV30_9GAMM|nr:lipid IV(A) 3-deoxy-D-manno-octulosonic acid transferase [Pelagibaculum spongiae]PVZ70198.1 3-deoxy-D-manno-octulosonic acid transferase [Pelagibaculum spongiae]
MPTLLIQLVATLFSLRFLYSLLFVLLLPVVLLRTWYRGIKSPEYRKRVGERLGFYRVAASKPVIWVHSVSVGETLAAVPLVKRLLADYPNHQLLITTMTPTGSARVQDLYKEQLGKQVLHVYAPWDLPTATGRFLKYFKPQLAIVMETELWPNWVAQCNVRKIPMLLANARLSERSAKGYAKVSGLTRPMFAGVDMIAAQTEQEVERFKTLGAINTQACGSIKFDHSLSDELKTTAAELKRQLGDRPIWIAASTRLGEDEILLQTHQQLLKQFPNLLMILVPRHPERFNAVADMIDQVGLTKVRRSHGQIPTEKDQVWLGDSMGEMNLMFGLVDIAFVGGSLVDTGGHNMLEPALWGVPVVTGQSCFNFLDISQKLQNCGGLKQVGDGQQLQQQISQWLTDVAAKQQAGDAAKAFIEQNRGAIDRVMKLIKHLL